jgi:prepilin-type N-terminal cleavage/methylation domain-containing protein
MKKRHSNSKGFSLIELIVAIAILAIVMIPMLRAFAISARTNAKAQNRNKATEAAQNILEVVEANSLDDLITYFNGTRRTKFDETNHVRLTKNADGSYAAATGAESGDTYYFALKDISGKDALVTIEPDNDVHEDSEDPTKTESWNDRSISKVSKLSADNDAIYTGKAPDAYMADILFKYPAAPGQSGVRRTTDITIEKVTESGSEYPKVTGNCRFNWTNDDGTSGQYPASATDGSYENIIFDNSSNTSEALNAVYLFYYPWYTSTIGNITDTINIVKQSAGYSDLTGLESGYVANVYVTDTMQSTDTVSHVKLHSNLDTNMGSPETGTVTASRFTLNGTAQTGAESDKLASSGLVEEITKSRLYKVTVEVYPSDAYDNAFQDSEVVVSMEGGMTD